MIDIILFFLAIGNLVIAAKALMLFGKSVRHNSLMIRRIAYLLIFAIHMVATFFAIFAASFI